ncbi:MAG: hypothetical protein CK425_12900 [Parachlamydia sp.]|nr:MAG: hypothetical protein CK425_12900 [Parachlamydia sp.]
MSYSLWRSVLKPLYKEMTKHVLESGNIFADETPIDMLAPGKGKVEQAYMWVFGRRQILKSSLQNL